MDTSIFDEPHASPLHSTEHNTMDLSLLDLLDSDLKPAVLATFALAKHIFQLGLLVTALLLCAALYIFILAWLGIFWLQTRLFFATAVVLRSCMDDGLSEDEAGTEGNVVYESTVESGDQNTRHNSNASPTAAIEARFRAEQLAEARRFAAEVTRGKPKRNSGVAQPCERKRKPASNGRLITHFATPAFLQPTNPMLLHAESSSTSSVPCKKKVEPGELPPHKRKAMEAKATRAPGETITFAGIASLSGSNNLAVNQLTQESGSLSGPSPAIRASTPKRSAMEDENVEEMLLPNSEMESLNMLPIGAILDMESAQLHQTTQPKEPDNQEEAAGDQAEKSPSDSTSPRKRLHVESIGEAYNEPILVEPNRSFGAFSVEQNSTRPTESGDLEGAEESKDPTSHESFHAVTSQSNDTTSADADQGDEGTDISDTNTQNTLRQQQKAVAFQALKEAWCHREEARRKLVGTWTLDRARTLLQITTDYERKREDFKTLMRDGRLPKNFEQDFPAFGKMDLLPPRHRPDGIAQIARRKAAENKTRDGSAGKTTDHTDPEADQAPDLRNSRIDALKLELVHAHTFRQRALDFFDQQKPQTDERRVAWMKKGSARLDVANKNYREKREALEAALPDGLTPDLCETFPYVP